MAIQRDPDAAERTAIHCRNVERHRQCRRHDLGECGGESEPAAPQTIYKWFNTAAFVAPAQYTFGNEGRDMVVGPPVNNVDFSCSRRLR